MYKKNNARKNKQNIEIQISEKIMQIGQKLKGQGDLTWQKKCANSLTYVYYNELQN